MTSPHPLRAMDITVGYRDAVLRNLSVAIPEGSFTAIIGPNGCGKSTLLRALARLLKPESGEIFLKGKPIGTYASREVARSLGLLPQSSVAPEGITVAELVARGRYPYQTFLRRWSRQDEVAVADAMAATGVEHLALERVDRLSGGQRQRTWIAMVLAQQTEILLLDEPTTYLDITHQVELLDLCRHLNREGRTLVAVLHDLNLACRYATHVIALRDGAILAEGPPTEIVTADLVRDVFGLSAVIIEDPISGGPLVVPDQKAI
ncbi:ABC transporter ATP-binding protein [Ensifer adhaerens]|uniref:ABC transporter ATP-binding protein n=1 Tax=Ensifer adhaerens TaxID=106592 RepID=UPI000CF0B104|nr:ABC transporter ATP-binding protein [Ensifer adhaerens]